jgi:hypothetical protein
MQNRHASHWGQPYVQTLEPRQLLAGTASISGAVYNDLNRNAVHEAGEAGIKRTRVYLDYDNDGAWDKGREPTTLTDKRGSFRFDGLGAGTYRLRQVVPSEMSAIGPRSGWFKATLADGQKVTRRLFADAKIISIGLPTASDVAIAGDTDFNGRINLDDFNRIGSGMGSSTRPGWINGDIDGNGVIDSKDYALIDAALQNAGSLGAVSVSTRPAPGH